MSCNIELQPAEELLLNVFFQASEKSEPFLFAVSSRALFIPRKKLFAVRDPRYFEKVPLSNVMSVSRIRLQPHFWWVLAALMVLVGTVTTISMVIPMIKGESGTVSGYPPAIVVVGLVIPFAVRRRFGIRIQMTNGSFLWKPPVVLDKASKNKIRNIQDQIISTCTRAGISTDDATTPEPLNQPKRKTA